MTRKTKKYVPKAFESSKGVGDVSANIYVSMLQNKTWQSLTPRQQRLYIYMKAQYYGQKQIEGQETESFYFNRSMWKETYKLYTNEKSFYTDRNALVEKGFITVAECGRTTRTKNIYSFSDKWKDSS